MPIREGGEQGEGERREGGERRRKERGSRGGGAGEEDLEKGCFRQSFDKFIKTHPHWSTPAKYEYFLSVVAIPNLLPLITILAKTSCSYS